MNTAKNTRPDAPSVIAKLAELGVDHPDINLLTTALYEGSIQDAAVKLHRIHQWLTISAMLRGVPGLPGEDLRKLHATFLDQGLSARFLSELDAAIQRANLHRQVGEKILISYAGLQARFYKVLAAT